MTISGFSKLVTTAIASHNRLCASILSECGLRLSGDEGDMCGGSQSKLSDMVSCRRNPCKGSWRGQGCRGSAGILVAKVVLDVLDALPIVAARPRYRLPGAENPEWHRPLRVRALTHQGDVVSEEGSMSSVQSWTSISALLRFEWLLGGVRTPGELLCQ